jgi:exodeoxyribonuclease-3
MKVKWCLMKLATFNANSIRKRQVAILEWLKNQKPDVLCIQETKVQDHEFPREPYEAAGYHVNFRGMKSYNGVAILSREKPTAVTFGLGDAPEADEPRLALARFNDYTIVNTYIPQGYLIESPKYTYKLEWFKRLRKFFDKTFSPKDPLIWCGDMNVAPRDLDVHHPEKHLLHVCFHENAKKAYAETLGWGFEDVFLKLYPGRQQFTFWDYRFRSNGKSSVEANLGWRIDHILATKPLADLCAQVEVDIEPRKAEQASDHTFLWAEFKI